MGLLINVSFSRLSRALLSFGGYHLLSSSTPLLMEQGDVPSSDERSERNHGLGVLPTSWTCMTMNLKREVRTLSPCPKTVTQGCNDTIPKALRLPKICSGKDHTVYDTAMDDAYGKQPVLFEELFKQHVADYNNISGSVIHFPSGPKHVYRSAMLAYSPKTLQELMLERGVRTIFHLSNKNTVNQSLWTRKEKEQFFRHGGKPCNYIHLLDFDYIFNDDDELFSGQKQVADIIQRIEKSEGNVLIHCLGGEHKTELIFEVLQKCYNGVGMENITQRYKCHTAWSPDPSVKHGYKQNNVDFIKDFPCALLRKS